ncbi:MAG TPA: four helix bundle protein [Candidatus Absconditabacterales bacterium]|nr:four helix bundle protein [Candidatus Absconditabacterales bacterium]
MKITKFEDLNVWKKSMLLNKKMYKITDEKVFFKDFGLRDQIRRASVSISSNIVEGFERDNNNEFIRFLKIAKGSCGEVRSQIYVAFSVGYIQEEIFKDLKNEFLELSKQIGGFIKYLEGQRKIGNFLAR